MLRYFSAVVVCPSSSEALLGHSTTLAEVFLMTVSLFEPFLLAFVTFHVVWRAFLFVRRFLDCLLDITII